MNRNAIRYVGLCQNENVHFEKVKIVFLFVCFVLRQLVLVLLVLLVLKMFS